MNIIKPRLIWKEPLVSNDPSNINVIALHHLAAITATAEQIHSWHLAQGWKGAGYGWYVRKDGSVYEMRGFNLNAGVENENDHILSIAFEGNYDIESIMPDIQIKAGIELIEWLRSSLPNLKSIDGHYMWTSTTCPGKYFQLAEFRNGERKKVEVKTVEETKKVDVPEWKIDGAKFIFYMGITDSLHDPLEVLDVGLYGAMRKKEWEKMNEWVDNKIDNKIKGGIA